MRTSDVCPTCSTYTNALCVIYNGPNLSTLNINTSDSIELVLTKLEAFASGVDGATPNLQAVTDIGNITTTNIVVPSISFALDADVTASTGQFAWNDNEKTLDLGLLNDSVLQVGQEVLYHGVNASGVNIVNGMPIMARGTVGASGKIIIGPADMSVPENAKYFLGIATEDIAIGDEGYVTSFGKVRKIDTTGASVGQTWSEEEVLWVDNSNPGQLTNVEPTTGVKLPVAYILTSHAQDGVLSVRTTTGVSLKEAHDISLTNLTTNDVLKWDGTKWINSLATTVSTLQDITTNGNTTDQGITMYVDGLNRLLLIRDVDGNKRATLDYKVLNIKDNNVTNDKYLKLEVDDAIKNRITSVGTKLTSTGFKTSLTFPDGSQQNTIDLPNASGTVALTSDLVDNTLQEVITAGNTYTSDFNTWTWVQDQLSLVNTEEDWGFKLNAEQFVFTNSVGSTIGKSEFTSTYLGIGNGTYSMSINSFNITSNRSVTFQDADGTLALTSDLFSGEATDVNITDAGGYFVSTNTEQALQELANNVVTNSQAISLLEPSQSEKLVDFTVAVVDNNTTIFLNSATPITITVDADSLPTYGEVYFINDGAGTATVVSGTAALSTPDGATLATAERATLIRKLSNNDYRLYK